MTTDYTSLISQLTLDQKIAVLSGRDFWHTVSIPEIGLESMRLSDGPSGVRGESFDERQTSISLPSASALAATWRTDLAQRYGEVAASEAIDKQVQIVLGPTINLHRSPLGGRHFEAYSEDPILTGELASAFVKGVQSKNVGACPKHYIANDSETERFTVDAIVATKPLHELYLRPFEIAVKNSQPWMLMSSYNSVNGYSMSESPLLETPLKTEWGFDGVVVSDWTAVRSVQSAASAQDLAMPGPFTPWNQGLKQAVETGEISESTLDLKIERILRLAERVGKLANSVEQVPLAKSQRLDLALEVAEQGSVLLRNNGLLPLTKGVTIAVSGDSAARPRIQGGGSATVLTDPVLSPLAALRQAFGENQVTYAVGAELLSDCATFSSDRIMNPVTGEPGVRVTFFDSAHKPIRVEDRGATFFIWEAEPGFVAAQLEVEFVLDVSSTTTSDIALGAATVNPVRLEVDGEIIFERLESLGYDDIATAILAPTAAGAKLNLRGRNKLHVKTTVTNPGIPEAQNMTSLMIGEVARNDDPQLLISEAVAQAKDADVAVVVVGTNSAVESEGFDRTTIALPGYQDDLVRAVAAANPKTIVIVNSGSPVDLPWRDDVAAILVSWFGGQRMSEAIARVLSGRAEPAGRLPTSWVQTGEAPPLSTTPSGGKLRYEEGIHIGYRRLAEAVEFPFGFGLGWASWAVSGADVSLDRVREILTVTAELQNLSAVGSQALLMVFASKTDSKFERPKRWLIGWVRPETTATRAQAKLEIPLHYLDSYQEGWQREVGEYQLQLVADARTEGLSLSLTL